MVNHTKKRTKILKEIGIFDGVKKNLMKSYALVLGNNNYTYLNKLNNAVNDAKAISNSLENLGVEVSLSTDFSRSDYGEISANFLRKIEEYNNSYKEDIVAMFFYFGHGVQIDGDNYLLPIDINDKVEKSQFKYDAIPLAYIITDFNKEYIKVKIFVLDACRENIFDKEVRGIVSSNLAPIYAPKGSIIAFSTSPGEKAKDGIDGQNSIYTRALLNHIKTPNISIEECFKRVRESVYTLSDEEQLPWEHSCLIGHYCFNNGDRITADSENSIKIYKENVIKDSLYSSDGSEFSIIIDKLKSYNWYEQVSKIKTLEKKSPKDFTDINQQFLLGRNLLQVAEGNEYNAVNIFENKLGSFLNNWNIKNENHVLNGILFEIYFNSKGEFRGLTKLKAKYLNAICNLSQNKTFKNSFDFIQEVLSPYKNYLLFIPHYNPTQISLNISFKEMNFEIPYGSKVIDALALVNISKGSQKILELEPNKNDCTKIKYVDLKTNIYEWFHIPTSYINITHSHSSINDSDEIWVPKSNYIESFFMDFLK